MNRNSILLVTAIVLSAAIVLIARREAGVSTTSNPPPAAPTRPSSPAVTVEKSAPHEPPPALAPTEEIATAPAAGDTNPSSTKTDLPALAKTQTVAKAKGKKVVQDSAAREALALVGVDGDAEIYWFEAFQDPTLPRSERQDLIDDLNEEGLADPKHPTPDDLPLILSRLAILEEVAPTIPEDLDWTESYSDLLNLADLATGGGKPVQ